MYAAKDLKNLIIKAETAESEELIYLLTNISLDISDITEELFKTPKDYLETKQ